MDQSISRNQINLLRFLVICVAAYFASLALSLWTWHQFGATLIWTANGVLLAAALVSPKRTTVVLVCGSVVVNLAANHLRASTPGISLIFAALNGIEVTAVSLLARRFCGRSIDFRSPVKLGRFAFLAVLPTCLVVAAAGTWLTAPSTSEWYIDFLVWFLGDASGLLVIAPAFILLGGDNARPSIAQNSRGEQFVLIGLLIAACLVAFWQRKFDLAFLPFLPLAIIAYRLPPRQSAESILVVAFMAAFAMFSGAGSLTAIDPVPVDWTSNAMLRAMPPYFFYMLIVTAFTLPTSTLWSERRRLEILLRLRTAAAQRARDRALRAEADLRRAALHDVETGLLNRAGIKQILLEGGESLSGAAFSIDRFTSIRTAIGMENASKLVSGCADRLQTAVSGPVIGRITPRTLFLAADGDDVIGRALKAFEEPVIVAGLPIDVNLTVGLAGPGPAQTAIQRALAAVSQAHASGMPLACFDAEIERMAARSLTLMSDLRAAVGTDALFLAYQPKLHLPSGKISGAEVLIRWTRAGEAVPPSQFVTLSEETGFIDQLTDWILCQAIAAQSAVDVDLAINISARSLATVDYGRRLATVVRASGGDPKRLTLEVTETAIMADPAMAISSLNELRNEGFEVAIDDFGTGQSSLSYLRDLPATALKLDQSIVRHVATDERSASLVSSTIDLAHRLGFIVVAEGVEDQPTLEFLVASQCDEAQGYHVGRPGSLDTLRQLVSPC